MQHHPKEQNMFDVEFDKAMRPLAEAMFQALKKVPNSEDHITAFTHGAAAVLEALGIPAWMVADPAFRRGLEVVVAAVKMTAPPVPPADVHEGSKT
jgi:hypothetical protein